MSERIVWACLPKDERLAILAKVANDVGIPENAVEKDYWVSVVLETLFSSSYSESLLFKGGTSLSKGWGLIERFSEDVDLALNPSLLGFDGGVFGKGRRDRLRRASKQFVETVLRNELQERMEEMGLAGCVNVEVEPTVVSDKDPMVLLVNYKSILQEKSDYINDKVKLEVSCRSMMEPYENLQLSSMIAADFPDVNFETSAFFTRTVLPARTFLEKVFLLHEEFNRPGGCLHLDRMSRHLYDIEKMMDCPFAIEAIADATLYSEIVAHRSVMTAWHGLDYKTHHPTTINFMPPSNVVDVLRDDYMKMQQNFIYGDALQFDRLLDRLYELQDRFRENKWTTPFFGE